MEKLSSGEFFGITAHRLESEETILTKTAYTHDYVDWHEHENAYFTFILAGNVVEGNKKGKTNLSAGSLLFHNAQESHYNIKPKGNTYGMHLEILTGWMDQMKPVLKATEGSFEITCPKTKILFYKILKESSMADGLVNQGIQQLAIAAMASLLPERKLSKDLPAWLKLTEELLQDTYLSPQELHTMAKTVGVHPVHLSRSFNQYYGCTMATYVRRIKVERAMAQLSVPSSSLSTIAHQCGFADQSHMIRCFKEIGGATPSFYRGLIRSFPKC